jgi:DNA-binding transcriptional ArsR family regulator
MEGDVTPQPRVVVGPEALATLAVPARFAILDHLLAAGPRTASQCAAVIGETPSNCSWHLRALAKVGLVERAEPVDGDARTRPWRATAPGFDFSGGRAAAVAGRAVEAIVVQRADDLFARYSGRRDELPEDWRAAEAVNEYALQLTSEELLELGAAIDALVRRYVRPIRADPPDGSAVAHLTLRAFLDPDLHP